MTISVEPPPRVNAPPRAVRPSVSFMFARLSRLVALGFGSGLAPWAPGTFGTLWAWIVWQPLAAFCSKPVLLALICAGFALGVWACERTALALGVADHGGIVWDEVIAFWLVLLLVPAGFASQFWAFLLFRLFDITKPPPIRRVEKSIPGGLGVMFDDILAAAYTVLVFFVMGGL